AIDRVGTDIETKLKATLAEQHPLSVIADKEAVLGTTHVVLLRKNDALLDLHTRLIDLLEANGAVFNSPEFTRQGFLPHSKIQKAGRLRTDDEFKIETIALIDMFPDGNWQ